MLDARRVYTAKPGKMAGGAAWLIWVTIEGASHVWGWRVSKEAAETTAFRLNGCRMPWERLS